jgi:hypothetical protein
MKRNQHALMDATQGIESVAHLMVAVEVVVNENFCWVSAMVTLEAQQQQQQIKYNRQQMSFLLGLAAGIGA